MACQEEHPRYAGTNAAWLCAEIPAIPLEHGSRQTRTRPKFYLLR